MHHHIFWVYKSGIFGPDISLYLSLKMLNLTTHCMCVALICYNCSKYGIGVDFK